MIVGLAGAIAALAGCTGSSGDRPAVSSTTATTVAGEESGAGHEAPAGLVYATRDGNRVTVYRRPLEPGDREVLFGYDEPASDIPPQVAVSTGGTLVAYIVEQRILHVRDLSSGDDDVLLFGDPQQVPPNADVTPPRWSDDGMNLSPEDQEECPECGIFAIGHPQFSPSGTWIAFAQTFYEGANWGLITLDGHQSTSTGEAGGTLAWLDDRTILTVGTFYGDPGYVYRGVVDHLPAVTMVDTGGGKRRNHIDGALSPDGTSLAVLFKENASERGSHLGLLPLSGGPLTIVDGDGENLTVGFSGDNTLVWVEDSDETPALFRQGAQPVPLPGDLHLVSRITPLGPRRVGLTADTCVHPFCDPRPEHQPRYLIVDLDAGAVIWAAPPSATPQDSPASRLERSPSLVRMPGPGGSPMASEHAFEGVHLPVGRVPNRRPERRLGEQHEQYRSARRRRFRVP